MPLAGTVPATSIYPGENGYFFGGITPPPYSDGKTEFAETLTTDAKSQTVTVASQAGNRAGIPGRTITWETTIAGGPSGATINLQGAMRDVDAEYVTVDSSTSTTGEVKQTSIQMFEYWRILVGTITGGSNNTIIAKMRAL